MRKAVSPALAVRLKGVSVLALALAAVAPGAAFAQSAGSADTDAQLPATTQDDEIVVTGFRGSLDKAINVKRDSVSAVDAIVAEDIAKFPDQNLAESLQRIPGIAITRDGGEGRQITVRGLGAGYTRVRLNGMETVATSAGEGGPNRGRDFDFNVFASELFSSLVVHKTAEANLDEGSLGAVVDLNTGNPMSYKDGFTFGLNAKAQYNDLSKDWGPRLAGLIGYKDPNGLFAVSASVAWSKYDTLESGNNTVRWQQARFNSVNGTPCYTTNRSGGTYIPGADCDAAALAFHPRIPRYGVIGHDRERLGATGSIQIAPSDRTLISLDGLYARYDETRWEKWGEVLFRSNERGIDLADVQIDGNNNLVSATVNNAWVRIEDFRRESYTDFYQFNGKIEQEFSDRFKATLFAGMSKSKAVVPSETTIIFDNRSVNGYRYDYSNMDLPLLSFPDGTMTPSSFQFAEFRDRPSDVTNQYRTAKLDLDWKVADGFGIQTGPFFRRFEFDTTEATRDSTYCAAFTCAAGTYGAPVTSAISEMYTLPNVGNAPSGTTLTYLVPNLDAAAAQIDLYNRPLNPSSSNIRNVVEKDYGGYFQVNAKGTFLGLDYATNAGVRFIRTDVESTGINNAQTVTVNRSYEDWLPSFNLALYPARDVVVRGAVAKVMTRPGLGSLTPGGSVDGFNYRITFGNPALQPTRATTYDLALEWYFQPQAVISIAAFKKDIESFPLSSTTTGTYASTGLPLSLILASSPAAANPEGQPWTINTTINGPGAKIKGLEFSLQTPFSFLPGVFKNFGFIGNVTYVDSNVDYTVRTPATTVGTGSFPVLGTEVQTRPLLGLSKWSYNATLYYEDSKFSIRGSVAYRSRYSDGTSATGNVFEGFNPTFNADLSASYAVTPWMDVTFEALNLTDDYQDRFVDAEADRNYEYDHTGRVFLFGARLKL
ncbi:MAG: TonB-dependent receptor [Pseudomonadota bacterium]